VEPKIMQFVVIIHCAPYSHQAAYTAYRFCKALLASGQQIRQIFFYQQGVYHALSADEMYDSTINWREFARTQAIPLVLCRTAAEQRGLRPDQPAYSATLISHASLAQLVQACQTADRVVSFG
jgi:tRNA 2-thiouridine synthesizing protein D